MALLQTSSAGQQNKVAGPQTALQGFHSRIDELLTMQRQHHARLQDILDRANGAAPEKDGASQAREVPRGILGETAQKLDDLMTLTAGCAALTDRIEAII